MKQEGLFTMTSGLQNPWFVVQADTLIHKLHKQVNQWPCKKFTVKDDMEYPEYDHVERTWRHLNFLQHVCYLHKRRTSSFAEKLIYNKYINRIAF